MSNAQKMWSNQSIAHEPEICHRHGCLGDHSGSVLFSSPRCQQMHFSNTLQWLPRSEKNLFLHFRENLKKNSLRSRLEFFLIPTQHVQRRRDVPFLGSLWCARLLRAIQKLRTSRFANQREKAIDVRQHYPRPVVDEIFLTPRQKKAKRWFVTSFCSRPRRIARRLWFRTDA